MKTSPASRNDRAGALPLKTRVFNLATLAVLFVMLFLLLKENEGRVAAEEKLKDMRYKVDTFASEKENVILTLEARIGELENRLQEVQFTNQQMAAESQKQTVDLTAQLEESRLKYETLLKDKTAEISELQKRSLDDGTKLSALLREKNAEVADLSARLKDASTRADDLIRKKQELETKNLSMAEELTLTKNRLKNLERQHAELAGAMKEVRVQKQGKD